MLLALTSESIPIFRSGTQIRLSDQNSQNPYPFSNQKAIPLGVADIYIAYTGGGVPSVPLAGWESIAPILKVTSSL